MNVENNEGNAFHYFSAHESTWVDGTNAVLNFHLFSTGWKKKNSLFWTESWITGREHGLEWQSNKSILLAHFGEEKL